MLKALRQYSAVIFSTAIVIVGLLVLHDRSQPNVYAQANMTPTPTAAATVTASSIQRTVSVTGSGQSAVQPDLARVDLGVTTEAQTASQALTQNNTQMQAVVNTLTKANIAATDIRTQTIQLYPRYATPTAVPQGQTGGPNQGTNQIIGYTATNTVEVTVRNLNNLGTLLDQVVSAGGNTVQNISFDLSNPSQGMDQARDAAMKDALHKAQQLASLSNLKLGTVISINESSHVPVPYQASGTVAGAAASAVPVSAGTQTVTVDIQVTWELQP